MALDEFDENGGIQNRAERAEEVLAKLTHAYSEVIRMRNPGLCETICVPDRAKTLIAFSVNSRDMDKVLVFLSYE